MRPPQIPRDRSRNLYQIAQERIVGGVNSPSRSFKAVGGQHPVFMHKGKGAYLWDVDGNRYIDFQAAFGPIIAGHAHPHIVEAIATAASEGSLYGTSTPWEIQLAEMLQAAIPSLERIRFVNSGTEAVMTAIRLARACTGRDKVIKFAGCYHGHSDLVLVAAGSGPSTLGVPDSAGIPRSTAEEVITVPYNDLAALEATLEAWGEQTAAVLVEPIVGNFGIVLPDAGFLQGINEMSHRRGALVIYDEVISAFRFTYGGAQQLFHVEPDVTVLGKIIGGGLPIGAYGGKREIMEQVSPLGTTYQAGTMAGNPASVRAGIACLELLQDPAGYQRMDCLGKRLEQGLLEAAARHGVDVVINRLNGALTLFFATHPVRDYQAAQESDSRKFACFFQAMLEQGIFLAPSKFEAWFLTLSHEEEHIDRTLAAADQAFARVRRLGDDSDA